MFPKIEKKGPIMQNKTLTKKRPVAGGSFISRSLLYALREMRQGGPCAKHPEEIEFWENQIRAIVKDRRREPLETLELDATTVAALNEAFPHENRHFSMRDIGACFRRRFAVRMIRAGCEAMIRDPEQREFGISSDFAAELRNMTAEELQIERLSMQCID
jgi:hypothetical protein